MTEVSELRPGAGQVGPIGRGPLRHLPSVSDGSTAVCHVSRMQTFTARYRVTLAQIVTALKVFDVCHYREPSRAITSARSNRRNRSISSISSISCSNRASAALNGIKRLTSIEKLVSAHAATTSSTWDSSSTSSRGGRYQFAIDGCQSIHLGLTPPPPDCAAPCAIPFASSAPLPAMAAAPAANAGAIAERLLDLAKATAPLA